MKKRIATILLIITAIAVPGGSLILLGTLAARRLKGRKKNGSSNSKTGIE